MAVSPCRLALVLLATALSACGGLLEQRGKVVTANDATLESIATGQALASLALPESSPASLTGIDGTDLGIETLHATTRIHGTLAETEMRLAFANHTSRRMEGRFRFVLPPHASLSHLAMKIRGRWRDADAAELGAARETYEAIEHRQRDPLLVEQRREREITARIFPIEGLETKEIALSYVAEIGPDAPVVVPLRGLPVVRDLQVSVVDGATEPVGLHLEGRRPTEDVRFSPALPEGKGALAARAGDLAALRVTVGADAADSDPLDAGMVFLVSTTASEAADLRAKAHLLESIATALTRSGTRGTLPVVVVAYDQTRERVYEGDLQGLVAAGAPAGSLSQALAARGALGAHDLEAGLAAAAGEARQRGARRVVLVGGGAATAGAIDPTSLRSAARALAASGVERLDVLVTSQVADPRVYAPLISSEVFLRDGLLVDDALSAPAGTMARQLTARSRDAAITVEGATWTSQAVLRRVFPGESRTVLASVPAANSLRLRLDGEPVEVSSVVAPPIVLDHAVAVSKLDALVARGEKAGFDAPLRKEIVDLARAHRLASPFTALLVLESETDRRMLRAIEAKGETRAPRAPVAAAVAPPRPQPPLRTGAVHTARAPAIRMATVMVSGRLPPESIQREVRQQFGVFRGCYAEGLMRRGPSLAGRVTVRFVIDGRGNVESARDGGSELDDRKVIECIVHAFTELTFGVADRPTYITVVYPLQLTPDESEIGRAPTPARLEPNGGTRRPSGIATALPPPPPPSPWSEDYADVARTLERAGAVNAAAALLRREPSAAAWSLLGEAFEASGDVERAARAYGSLADLYPELAEMLRAAAVRIDRARPGDATALSLLRHARDDRPDQPSSHHLLGLTLLRAGKFAAAFEALAGGLGRTYEARYQGATDLLRSDLRLAAMAWSTSDPLRAAEIARRMSVAGVPFLEGEEAPGLRASLAWETDTSSLELSVLDAPGVAGALTHLHVAEAHDGFGPEMVLLDHRATRSIGVRLDRRGVGGEVLGVAHVIRHGARGVDLRIETRPFVIMNEAAELSLGSVVDVTPAALAQSTR